MIFLFTVTDINIIAWSATTGTVMGGIASAAAADVAATAAAAAAAVAADTGT
jgi:hypothetical protein